MGEVDFRWVLDIDVGHWGDKANMLALCVVVGTCWHGTCCAGVAESRGPFELHVIPLSLPPSPFSYSLQYILFLWFTSSHLLGNLNWTRTPSLRRTDTLVSRRYRNDIL